VTTFPLHRGAIQFLRQFGVPPLIRSEEVQLLHSIYIWLTSADTVSIGMFNIFPTQQWR
jgi:hypothetical protein